LKNKLSEYKVNHNYLFNFKKVVDFKTINKALEVPEKFDTEQIIRPLPRGMSLLINPFFKGKKGKKKRSKKKKK
jgi:hypothetical protein